LLFAGTRFFINGDLAPVGRDDRQAMQRLANQRSLGAAHAWSPEGVALLHEWYLCGFLHPGAQGAER
jgi:hypothetical protein